MENEVEVRTFNAEFREDGEKKIIRGYPIVFNKLSEDLGGFKEEVAPEAVKDTIQKDDIRALFNHDANYVLGRNKAGTLRLNPDDKGLAFEIDLPETQWARDLHASIKRGDITQGSFGFRINKEQWNSEKGKMPIRRLLDVSLRDVSIVTFPAYPQTSAKVRDYLTSLKEAEKPDPLESERTKESLARNKRCKELTELI
jgi:uncharacterized protein